MSLEYSITYTAENSYENEVNEACWQFLIIPENNYNQQVLRWDFKNSLNLPYFTSNNGLGYNTLRINSIENLREINFEFNCVLLKNKVNPFDIELNLDPAQDFDLLSDLDFKVLHEPYLKKTKFTLLPEKQEKLFVFDDKKSVFDNMMALNHWVYDKIFFKTGVTDVDTTLEEIVENRHGVCQDFTHLFCALARLNGVPARYVSGYIGQGNQFFGDLQMHAWAEVYIPVAGWVGFDPTNNILAAENHIKVCHGKDYNDCSPLRGVVYTSGGNSTNYSVKVQSQQIQQ